MLRYLPRRPLRFAPAIAAAGAVALVACAAHIHDDPEEALPATHPFLADLPLDDASRIARPEPVLVHGLRDVRNLAWLDDLAGVPIASTTQGLDFAALAIDGDPATAWRGAEGETHWEWILPFRVPIHLGLIRAWFGDSAARGVPSAYHWDYDPVVDGACAWNQQWKPLPDGAVDDRHPNEFVHGPKTVHAQKQVVFTDASACAVRLVIDASEGGAPPVIRELALHASATSLTREPGVEVIASRLPLARGEGGGEGLLSRSKPEHVIDGLYSTFWSGDPGAGPWTLEVRWPTPRKADRLGMRLGYDAVTVDRADDAGRDFSGAHMPLRYRIEIDSGDGVWVHLPEADPPEQWGSPLPVRRRLVHLHSVKTVRALRMTIDEATGFWGERDPKSAAPVIRDLALYGPDDRYPVIEPPLFLSVNANPSRLTSRRKGGEAYSDGGFARDAYSRLRRIVAGFDTDTRWPADASRPRDDGTGRFLEAIEGDDPVLGRALLVESAPPPVVMLSGGFSWTMDEHTAPDTSRKGAWFWDVTAPADSPDRGMGALVAPVRERVAPFLGFCGGAQILAALEAWPTMSEELQRDGRDPYDGWSRLFLGNGNEPVDRIPVGKEHIELAWWLDAPKADASRPVIHFDASDPMFETLAAGGTRTSTRQLPSSHYAMIRASAFEGPLSALKLTAYSEYCAPWVLEGPELTWEQGEARCVRVPQAFRSRDDSRYPIMGYQFHPEQRDLPRLAPGAPAEERGDALNAFANGIDLAIVGYLRLYWPEN